MFPLELWIEIYLLTPITSAGRLAKCCTQLNKRFRQEDIWERRFRRDLFNVEQLNVLNQPTELIDPLCILWVRQELRNNLKDIFEQYSICSQKNINFKAGFKWFQIDCFSKITEKCTTIKSWRAFYKSFYFEVGRLSRYDSKYGARNACYLQHRTLEIILSQGKHIQIVDLSNSTKNVFNLYMSNSCLVTIILPVSTRSQQFLSDFKSGKYDLPM